MALGRLIGVRARRLGNSAATRHSAMASARPAGPPVSRSASQAPHATTSAAPINVAAGGQSPKTRTPGNDHPHELGIGERRQNRRRSVFVGDDQQAVAGGREHAEPRHHEPNLGRTGHCQIHGNSGVISRMPAACVQSSVVRGGNRHPQDYGSRSRSPSCRRRPRSATKTIGWNALVPGRVAISTPRNPTRIAIIRSRPTRSPSNGSGEQRNENRSEKRDGRRTRRAAAFAARRRRKRSSRTAAASARLQPWALRANGRQMRPGPRDRQRDHRRAYVARPDDLRDRQAKAKPFGRSVEPGEADHRGAHQRDREDAHAAVFERGPRSTPASRRSPAGWRRITSPRVRFG